MYVAQADLFKTISTLIKFNDGVYKTPKQAAFLNKVFQQSHGLCPACMGLEGFEDQHDHGEVKDRFTSIEYTVKWADYGQKSVRFVTRLIEFDQFGIVKMWKLHRVHDGGYSTINPKKYELVFERTESEALENLKTAQSEQAVEQEQQAASSEFVGQIKDKVVIDVTVEGLYSFSTTYGVTTLVTMRDTSGNVFTWFAASDPKVEKGQQVKMKGTVKAHQEYKGVKQTVLTRCKVV